MQEDFNKLIEETITRKVVMAKCQSLQILPRSTLIVVNTVGHTIAVISRFKTLEIMLWCTLFTNPEYLTSEVHVVS